MTDETTPQSVPPKKDEKKTSFPSGRGPKKNGQGAANPRTTSGSSTQAPTRPSSRSNNKKSYASTAAADSGSESASKKSTEGNKKTDQRRNGGNRNASYRKAQPSASQGRSNNPPKDQAAARQSPGPNITQMKESDALSSLQRVIADLKTASPAPPQANAIVNPSFPSQSNPPAPFQAGSLPFPLTTIGEFKHKKAVSLGAPSLSGNFNSFSPNLGAMLEDAEEPGSFEEGEIQEQYYAHPTHQPRSQSQSFVAPRFAALAQQEQGESLGPTGRPQLAPGFMFGARKRATPVGPPISEEDVGFQFPQQQQQQQPSYRSDAGEQASSKSDNGEITGIMAEQVNNRFFDVLLCLIII